MPSKYEKLDALIVAEIERWPCASHLIWMKPDVAAELERLGKPARNIGWIRANRLQVLKKRGIIEHVGVWRIKHA